MTDVARYESLARTIHDCQTGVQNYVITQKKAMTAAAQTHADSIAKANGVTLVLWYLHALIRPLEKVSSLQQQYAEQDKDEKQAAKGMRSSSSTTLKF